MFGLVILVSNSFGQKLGIGRIKKSDLKTDVDFSDIINADPKKRVSLQEIENFINHKEANYKFDISMVSVKNNKAADRSDQENRFDKVDLQDASFDQTDCLRLQFVEIFSLLREQKIKRLFSQVGVKNISLKLKDLHIIPTLDADEWEVEKRRLLSFDKEKGSFNIEFVLDNRPYCKVISQREIYSILVPGLKALDEMKGPNDFETLNWGPVEAP